VSRGDVLSALGSALVRGDRETARRLYYNHVIPNPAFSHREADRLSYRVGAIDEGERHTLTRADL
jgi:hypothetical protein